MSSISTTNPNIPIYTGNTNTNAGGTSSPNGSVLTQSDFLNLLVSQLQNQDPTDPESDTDFASQMAQFSTLNATDSLDTTMTNYTQFSQMSEGASMIGATVTTSATDSNGNAISGVVSSVGVNNGTVDLTVNGQSVPISDITSVAPTMSSS